MIDVTEVGDLTFEVRFEEKIRDDLQLVSGWGSVADAIRRILSDIILGCEPHHEYDVDLPPEFWEGFPDNAAP